MPSGFFFKFIDKSLLLFFICSFLLRILLFYWGISPEKSTTISFEVPLNNSFCSCFSDFLGIASVNPSVIRLGSIYFGNLGKFKLFANFFRNFLFFFETFIDNCFWYLFGFFYVNFYRNTSVICYVIVNTFNIFHKWKKNQRFLFKLLLNSLR